MTYWTMATHYKWSRKKQLLYLIASTCGYNSQNVYMKETVALVSNSGLLPGLQSLSVHQSHTVHDQRGVITSSTLLWPLCSLTDKTVCQEVSFSTLPPSHAQSTPVTTAIAMAMWVCCLKSTEKYKGTSSGPWPAQKNVAFSSLKSPLIPNASWKNIQISQTSNSSQVAVFWLVLLSIKLRSKK